jgi:hypothetical protein
MKNVELSFVACMHHVYRFYFGWIGLIFGYIYLSVRTLIGGDDLPFLGSLDSMDRLHVSLFTNTFRSSPSPSTSNPDYGSSILLAASALVFGCPFARSPESRFNLQPRTLPSSKSDQSTDPQPEFPPSIFLLLLSPAQSYDLDFSHPRLRPPAFAFF